MERDSLEFVLKPGQVDTRYPHGTGPFYNNRGSLRDSQFGSVEGVQDLSVAEIRRRRARGKRQRKARRIQQAIARSK